MRILITGYYGFGNFGDDMLLACTYRLVKQRFPDSTIAIFANFPYKVVIAGVPLRYSDYLYRIVGANVDLVDWTHRGRFDLIVHGGGGTFFDVTQGGVTRQFVNSLIKAMGAPAYFKVKAILRWFFSRPARISATRRIGIGLGVGPYSPGGRRLIHEAEVLGNFSILAVRDPGSLKWCNRLGLARRVSQYTDLVFAANLWRSDVALAPEDIISIVICAGKPGNTALIESAVDLQRRGYRVRMVLLDPNHDAVLKLSLESRFATVICWDPHLMSLADFASILGSSSQVVSNRAHGLIVAAALGVPTICISTDEKLRSIQRMLPQSSILLKIEEIAERLPQEITLRASQIASLRCLALDDAASRCREANEMIAHVLS